MIVAFIELWEWKVASANVAELSYIANGFSSKKSYKVLSIIRALKAIQNRIKTLICVHDKPNNSINFIEIFVELYPKLPDKVEKQCRVQTPKMADNISGKKLRQ